MRLLSELRSVIDPLLIVSRSPFPPALKTAVERGSDRTRRPRSPLFPFESNKFTASAVAANNVWDTLPFRMTMIPVLPLFSGMTTEYSPTSQSRALRIQPYSEPCSELATVGRPEAAKSPVRHRTRLDDVRRARSTAPDIAPTAKYVEAVRNVVLMLIPHVHASSDERQPYLATMRMAGERQRYATRNEREDIRAVGEQEDRRAIVLDMCERRRDVVSAGPQIT